MYRAATAGKAPEAWILQNKKLGRQLMWPPLWRSCLPQIGRGGPDTDTILVRCLQFIIILMICSKKYS